MSLLYKKALYHYIPIWDDAILKQIKIEKEYESAVKIYIEDFLISSFQCKPDEIQRKST